MNQRKQKVLLYDNTQHSLLLFCFCWGAKTNENQFGKKEQRKSVIRPSNINILMFLNGNLLQFVQCTNPQLPEVVRNCIYSATLLKT